MAKKYKELEMPKAKRMEEEDEFNMEELDLPEEGMEEEMPEEEGELGMYSDEELLAEIEKRGLSLDEEMPEEMPEEDMEEDEDMEFPEE